MLKRLYVDNYRCLVNFEFRPERVNLLLGKNGSGKSTFLDALRALARLSFGESAASVFPADTLPWWDNRRAQTLELEFEDAESGGAYVYRVVVRHPDKLPSRIAEEKLTLAGQQLFALADGALVLPGLNKPLPFEGTQSVLALGIGRDAAVQRFLAALSGLLVFRLNPWAFEPQARTEEPMLNVNGGNLVAFLRSWSQSDPGAFFAWRRSALEALPHLEDLQLRELVPGSRLLVGMKHADGRERLLSLESFSEGERVLLALRAIAGLGRADRFIALDEPDNFLAPSEIQPILRSFTIDAPAEEGAQLFVVTHHPESIDYLAPYSTWLFEKGADGLAKVRRLEFDRSRGERATDSVLSVLSA